MPLLLKGKQNFFDAQLDLNTAVIKGAIFEGRQVNDTFLKQVETATNATPIVVTITGHGWAAGDLVLIVGVTGNLAANGIWKIATILANTFELQRPDGTNATGSGAPTANTGFALNLTQLNTRDGMDACILGTPVTLTAPTITNGAFDSNNPTFTAVPNGDVADGAILYEDNGAAASDSCFFVDVGRFIVTLNTDAALNDTTLRVEPLAAGIANSQQLAFSNGIIATLTAAAAAGARSLTVSAISGAITAGNRALATKNVTQNFPVNTNGGDITLTVDVAGWFSI